MKLEDYLEKNPKFAIAFSGGVDSAFLVYAAKKCDCDFGVYYVKTPFQPDFELSDARKLSEQLNIQLTIIKLDILDFPEIKKNDTMRCYYCKKAMLSAIKAQAGSDGYQVIFDGSNASDDEGDRPGMKAVKELGILSPLRECGLVKDDIRKLSKDAELFTWNKPSYSCLATRTALGEELTIEKLQKTEAAQQYLMKLGFEDFRVRCSKDCALVQISKSQFPLMHEKRDEIEKELLTYYKTVNFDPEGR